MTILYRIDFKNKKLIGTHQLGTKAAKQDKKWQCNSCGNEYSKDGSVKGIAFSQDFVVCSHCVEQANEMLKGE